MKMRGLMLLLLAIAGLTMLPALAVAQSVVDSGASSSAEVSTSLATTRPQFALTYTRPTEKTKLHNYFFDTFGPYPIVGAAVVAGINQYEGTPPEWKQGAEGYGKRVGSNFAIAGVSTTTRARRGARWRCARCRQPRSPGG